MSPLSKVALKVLPAILRLRGEYKPIDDADAVRRSFDLAQDFLREQERREEAAAEAADETPSCSRGQLLDLYADAEGEGDTNLMRVIDDAIKGDHSAWLLAEIVHAAKRSKRRR